MGNRGGRGGSPAFAKTGLSTVFNHIGRNVKPILIRAASGATDEFINKGAQAARHLVGAGIDKLNSSMFQGKLPAKQINAAANRYIDQGVSAANNLGKRAFDMIGGVDAPPYKQARVSHPAYAPYRPPDPGGGRMRGNVQGLDGLTR